MGGFVADVTLVVSGHLFVDAESEEEATNRVMDGHYALSDVCIHGVDWEIDFMREASVVG